MKYQQGDYLLIFTDSDEVKEFLAAFKGEVIEMAYEGHADHLVVRGELGEEVDDLDVSFMQAEFYNGEFMLTEDVITDQLKSEL